MNNETMKAIADSIVQQMKDLYDEGCNEDQVLGVIVQRIDQLDN